MNKDMDIILFSIKAKCQLTNIKINPWDRKFHKDDTMPFAILGFIISVTYLLTSPRRILYIRNKALRIVLSSVPLT